MIKLCGCKRAKSLPGLIADVGLCLEHYNMLMYGNFAERKAANAYKQAVYCTAAQWAQEKLLKGIK